MKGKIKHGDECGRRQTRLYRIWHNMKQRCRNKNSHNYSRYGGRGIDFCEEWSDYTNFKKWAIENGYEDNLFLERLENEEGYSPKNCKWASSFEQMNNTRRNVFIEYRGEKMTIAQAAKKYNLKYSTLQTRITKLGYDAKKAIETPMNGVWSGSKN